MWKWVETLRLLSKVFGNSTWLIVEEGSLPEQIFSVGENSRHRHLKGPESVRKPCQCQVSRLLDRTAILLGVVSQAIKSFMCWLIKNLGLDTAVSVSLHARCKRGKKRRWSRSFSKSPFSQIAVPIELGTPDLRVTYLFRFCLLITLLQSSFY